MKSISIKEMLTQMKDFAILAIDLSYLSILFSSKETAEEVVNIAQKMDSLRYSLEKSVLKAAAQGMDENELIGILRLAAYSERISDIAAEMADKVLSGKIHEIEKTAIKESEEQFVKFNTDKELKNKSVAEIGDFKNIWIIAIKRKKDWIYHPDGKFKTRLKDIIFGIKV